MKLQELAQRIRNRRIEIGLSQDELAKKAGYTSRSSITKIEAGLVDLPISKIVILASLLETTPEWLMGWEETELKISDKFQADTLKKHNNKEEQKIAEVYNSLPDNSKKQFMNFLNVLQENSKLKKGV